MRPYGTTTFVCACWTVRVSNLYPSTETRDMTSMPSSHSSCPGGVREFLFPKHSFTFHVHIWVNVQDEWFQRRDSPNARAISSFSFTIQCVDGTDTFEGHRDQGGSMMQPRRSCAGRLLLRLWVWPFGPLYKTPHTSSKVAQFNLLSRKCIFECVWLCSSNDCVKTPFFLYTRLCSAFFTLITITAWVNVLSGFFFFLQTVQKHINQTISKFLTMFS